MSHDTLIWEIIMKYALQYSLNILSIEVDQAQLVFPYNSNADSGPLTAMPPETVSF